MKVQLFSATQYIYVADVPFGPGLSGCTMEESMFQYQCFLNYCFRVDAISVQLMLRKLIHAAL